MARVNVSAIFSCTLLQLFREGKAWLEIAGAFSRSLRGYMQDIKDDFF
jgi:hypothetical protein